MQFEKISAIQFNDISNTSGSNADGYEDFTNIITAVSPGGTYSFNADIYNGFDQDQVFVWIDFNRDGDFDDPDELTFTSNTSAGPFTSMIAIPVTTTPGKTRMRIRLHDSGLTPNNTSCGDSKYGQVEDYSVMILSPNSGNCDDNITLVSPTDDVINGNIKKEANLHLIAKNQIMGGNLILDSGYSVEMQSGFTVMQGATLTVQIDGCGNQ